MKVWTVTISRHEDGREFKQHFVAADVQDAAHQAWLELSRVEKLDAFEIVSVARGAR